MLAWKRFKTRTWKNGLVVLLLPRTARFDCSSRNASRNPRVHGTPSSNFVIGKFQREVSRSSTASDSVCPRMKAICEPSGEKANCAILSDVKWVSCR